MLKIAMAGAQDTGKTTIARVLSGRLSGRGILTHYVQEFARGYIPKAGNITSLAEELFLIEQQLKLERETPDVTEVMITDSPVFLSFVYSLLMVDARKLTKKDVIMLGRIYDKVLDHGGYDMVYMLPIRWPPRDDGVRPKSLRSINRLIGVRIEAFVHLHGLLAQNLVSPSLTRRDVLKDYVDFMEDITISLIEGAK